MNIVIMCCPGRELMVADLRKRLSPRDLVIEVWDAQREGAAVCALRAFETGLEAFKGKAFTVMQDDALPCWRWSDYAAEFMPDVEDGIIINWYAHPWVTGDRVETFPKHYELGGADFDPRFINAPGKSFIVCLATSWPRLWAERIASRLADAVEHDPRDDQGRRHGDDAYIAQVLNYYGAEYWTHTPSLIQHRGEFSAVADRVVPLSSHDARQSRCFVGAKFDATAFTGRVDVHWRRLAKEKKPMSQPEPNPVLDPDGRQLDVEHAQELPTKPNMPSLPGHVGNEWSLPPGDPFKVGSQCNECGDTTGECIHVAEVK